MRASAPVYAGLTLTENQVWMSNNVIYDTLPAVTEDATFEILESVKVSEDYDIDLSYLTSSLNIPEIQNDTIKTVKVATLGGNLITTGTNIHVPSYFISFLSQWPPLCRQRCGRVHRNH